MKTTGMPVVHVEMSTSTCLQIHTVRGAQIRPNRPTVALSIVSNERAKIYCALFHDTADVRSGLVDVAGWMRCGYSHAGAQGKDFGRLLGRCLLDAFVEQFAGDLSRAGHNLRDFTEFQGRIPQIIRDSVPLTLRPR